MANNPVVKREPSTERMLFSPDPRNGGPARRELAPAPPTSEPPPYSRAQAPSWRVQPPPSHGPGAPGQRSWLNTVQNDPEADRYEHEASPVSGAGSSSSVFPSYGAPNSAMRPNQRHAPGYTCPDCETTHTAAWRWYEGRKYCNACGLHRKANGKKRSERLIEQDKQRRQDKARAEREFLHRIDGGAPVAVKREGNGQ